MVKVPRMCQPQQPCVTANLVPAKRANCVCLKGCHTNRSCAPVVMVFVVVSAPMAIVTIAEGVTHNLGHILLKLAAVSIVVVIIAVVIVAPAQKQLRHMILRGV